MIQGGEHHHFFPDESARERQRQHDFCDMSNPQSRAVVPPKGRCINTKHKQPCWACKLPSSKEKDVLCRLVDEPHTGAKGLDLLRIHVETSIEWNSEIMRSSLRAKHAKDGTMATLCQSLVSQDASLLAKEDLLQLCRDWEFRSDIWRYPAAPASLPPPARPSREVSFLEGPQPSTSALRRSHLRCIDPSHSQPCQTCAVAPSEDEEHIYQLVGDPGRKNGEKKLRKFIQMTAEWNSPDLRKKLAQKFQHRTDLGTFGKVVANKEAANLRKPHLIRLCREWGFKSNIWQVKKAKQGKRPAGALGHGPESSGRAHQRQTPGETPPPHKQPRLTPQPQPQLQLQRTHSGARGRDRQVALLASVNEYLSNAGNEVIVLHHSGPSGVQGQGAGSAGLHSGDLHAMFQPSTACLERVRDLLSQFSRATDDHITALGVKDIDVINLIALGQEIAISKMKVEATKAQLYRVESQMTPEASAAPALGEMTEILSTQSILTEAEKTLATFLVRAPKVFPSHLSQVLRSATMVAMVAFTSCQALASLTRFCACGVHLSTLICIFTIFSDLEDQVVTSLHACTGKVLNHMIATSAISPILQTTIQSLIGTQVFSNPIGAQGHQLHQHLQVPITQPQGQNPGTSTGAAGTAPTREEEEDGTPFQGKP